MEWFLGILSAILMGVVGAIHQTQRAHSKRLSEHDVLFARLSDIPSDIEKHEKREDHQFADITRQLAVINRKVDTLIVDVAILKGRKGQ